MHPTSPPARFVSTPRFMIELALTTALPGVTHGRQALLPEPLFSSPPCNRDWGSAWLLLTPYRRGDETARRRIHQADQDDDRTHHLLHGRARHSRHGKHEGGG